MTNALTQYIGLYREHRATIEAHAPAALNALRPAALQALDGARLPRKGQDNYEATSLDELFAPDYGVNITRMPFTADPAAAFRCDVPNLSTASYFFFNDTFVASSTAKNGAGEGVVVESFAMAQERHPQVLQQYLGSLAQLGGRPEVALNTLLAQDGLLVWVPDGVHATKTIQLTNIYNASRPVMAVRRLLVVVGNNASARMLVCDHTQNAAVDYLGSEVVEIVAGEGSTFDYYDLEETSAGTHRVKSVFVSQAAGSNVMVDGITLSNGTTRNDWDVQVNGEGAETHLLGMTIASGTQHIDNHTHLQHNAPRCTSNEMFKYVLAEQAVGAFAGKVLVQQGCPRTVAYQGNRNIVADPTAKMYSKPQLEIYTDDVQCSHGSATGQLDDEALFYMQQRGIGEQMARTMLMQAFVSDVVDGVRIPALRERLHMLVERRFAGELASCGSCGGCGVRKG